MSASTALLASSSGSAPLPERRSANYDPSTWDAAFIDSINIDPLDESQARMIDELQAKVAYRLSARVGKPSMLLDLIDSLQQLDMRYLFEDQIVKALNYISDNRDQVLQEKDLHFTSLMFRLFRESSVGISQDVFEGFRDENNGWEACFLQNDPRKILSLYESSYMSFGEEELLDEIKKLTTNFLQELQASTSDDNLREKVRYALKIPLTRRFPRFHSLWFLNVYAKDEDKDSEILELARLELNRVQLGYRREVKEISRWWESSGLGEHIRFARNRVVEQFIWALSTASSEPQSGDCRKWIAKVTSLATLIDDTYDLYGTLDELYLFTDIVERWSVEDIHKLPPYMQILFMALFNHVNDLVYHILKLKKIIVIAQVRRMWVQLCKAYLQEAKWYHNNVIPTVEEYLDTSTITAGAFLILSHVYIIHSKDIDSRTLDWIFENKELTRLSSLIVRYTNDVEASKFELARGDAPSTMECYMHEKDVSKAEARSYVHYEIDQTWNKINKIRFENTLLQKSLIDGFVDLGRVCHFVYQDGDEFGYPTEEIRGTFTSLFFEPVPHNV